MPNGINYELDYEKRISEMEDRPLLEFIARQTFEFTEKCKDYDDDIASLKSGDRKASSIAGSISGTVTGIIVSVISYFTNKG